MLKKNNKGFSLIELIVVIAIMGILVMLAAPRFMGYVDKARVSRIVNDVKVVEGKIAERYITEEYEFDTWGDEVNLRAKADEEDKIIYSTESTVDKKDSTVVAGDYEIVKEVVRDEAGTTLKGTFYANKDGKVYYVDDKTSNGSVENEEIDGDNCPILNCGIMKQIDLPLDMKIDFGNFMGGMEIGAFIEMLDAMMGEVPKEERPLIEFALYERGDDEFLYFSIGERGINNVYISKPEYFSMLINGEEMPEGGEFFMMIPHFVGETMTFEKYGNEELMPLCIKKTNKDGLLCSEYIENRSGEEEIIDDFIFMPKGGLIIINEAEGSNVHNIKPNTLIGYKGTDTHIVIPEVFEIDGEIYPVEHIAPFAFSQHNREKWNSEYKKIESVVLPKNTITIGDNAFEMQKIEKITIPNKVTSIGIDAFAYNNITNINIPSSVVYLSGFAHNLLEEVVIPGTVKEIGPRAFKGGTIGKSETLRNVIISEGVEIIGERAFGYNTNLKSITIPSTMEKIKFGAFTNYDEFELEEITINVAPDNVSIEDGAINYYDNGQTFRDSFKIGGIGTYIGEYNGGFDKYGNYSSYAITSWTKQ